MDEPCPFGNDGTEAPFCCTLHDCVYDEEYIKKHSIYYINMERTCHDCQNHRSESNGCYCTRPMILPRPPKRDMQHVVSCPNLTDPNTAYHSAHKWPCPHHEAKE